MRSVDKAVNKLSTTNSKSNYCSPNIASPTNNKNDDHDQVGDEKIYQLNLRKLKQEIVPKYNHTTKASIVTTAKPKQEEDRGGNVGKSKYLTNVNS